MNFVTVANWPYRLVALNVIASHLRQYPGSKATFAWFGQFREPFFKAVQDYWPNVEFVETDSLCPHAHEPGYQYFKLSALHEACQRGEPFLYLDALSEIQQRPYEIEEALRQKSRFFIQYPRDAFFWNEKWTTNECFRRMGGDERKYREAFQYWSAVQAYVPTPENRLFISEMHQLMRDPLVAGPPLRAHQPDGPNGCIAHRSDQSVFSICIEQREWCQPFDPQMFARCGDVVTVQGWAPGCMSLLPRTDTVIRARQAPRDLSWCPLVPEDLLKKIMSISV